MYKKAWCDTRVMHQWIDDVWTEYTTIHNEQLYYLLLDKFSVHSESTVINKLNSLSTEVVYIPSHCTSELQPLDVGINKPFKNQIRKQYKKWFRTNHNKDNPTRELVMSWVDNAIKYINTNPSIIHNAWKQVGYQCNTIIM